jgi:hypothetical protein
LGGLGEGEGRGGQGKNGQREAHFKGWVGVSGGGGFVELD